MTLSIEEIREVLKLFIDSEMQDLRLEVGDVRLAVRKSGAAGMAAESFSPLAPPGQTGALAAATETIEIADAPVLAATSLSVREDWVAVTSPSVGVFYRRPAPDQPPFVEVGSAVAAGDPVGLIEVMKMFTGVAAPQAGHIVGIAVADATMVEFGQPLMYVEPA